jgi:RNA polymerase sigma-70 factor (ECF subfamily)
MVRMHTRICFRKYDSYGKPSKFRGDSKFSTWAYRVALNTAITCIEKKRKAPIGQYECGQHFIKEWSTTKKKNRIKLMYKAVYQFMTLRKH